MGRREGGLDTPEFLTERNRSSKTDRETEDKRKSKNKHAVGRPRLRCEAFSPAEIKKHNEGKQRGRLSPGGGRGGNRTEEQGARRRGEDSSGEAGSASRGNSG